MKELNLNDMKYLDEVVAEIYGHHAMIYNPEDRFCYLASPIGVDEGIITAIGIDEDDFIKMKLNAMSFDTNSRVETKIVEAILI